MKRECVLIMFEISGLALFAGCGGSSAPTLNSPSQPPITVSMRPSFRCRTTGGWSRGTWSTRAPSQAATTPRPVEPARRTEGATGDTPLERPDHPVSGTRWMAFEVARQWACQPPSVRRMFRSRPSATTRSLPAIEARQRRPPSGGRPSLERSAPAAAP